MASDSLVVLLPTKVVLKCATIIGGELSVMMDGITMMLVWLVNKLASHYMVNQ